MPMNRIQFQQGMSLPEFMSSFGTEEQCAEAVKQAKPGRVLDIEFGDFVKDQIGASVHGGRVAVDENKMSAAEIAQKTCGGVYRQACARNNQRVRLTQLHHRLCQHRII